MNIQEIQKKYMSDSLASKELNRELHEAKKNGVKVKKANIREGKRDLAIEEANQVLGKFQGLRLTGKRNDDIQINLPNAGGWTIGQAKMAIKMIQKAIELAQRIPTQK